MPVQNEDSEIDPGGGQDINDDSMNSGKSQTSLDDGKKDFDYSSQWHKNSLMLLMIFALILIAVSVTTVSLFSSQHDWNTGRECLECHTEIGDEFSDMLVTADIEPHENMVCTDCHQDMGLGFDDEHGANLPECAGCHLTVATNLSYDTEAHKQLYVNAVSDDWAEGGNEACIVCHTGFDVNSTFERPDYYNFTVDNTYSITNVEVSSTTHLNTYTWIKPGRVHTYVNGTNVNCGDAVSGCHRDVVASRLGGVSGGHQTATQPLNTTHRMTSDCGSCHWNSTEVLDINYHAAKNITCAYQGAGGECHDRTDILFSGNMTTMFNEIGTATDMSHQKEGDLCWGCHSGYNWIDPPGSMGGVDTWANYTTASDLVPAEHGTVAGTEANTHGAGTQDIEEVIVGITDVYTNYTVTGDQNTGTYHGTVAGTFADIDELPPSDSNTQIITEVSVAGSVTVVLMNESFEGAWPPAGWTETGNWDGEAGPGPYDQLLCADFDGGNGITGNLNSPGLDLSDATSFTVDFWYQSTLASEVGDLALYYWDGTAWDFIANLGGVTSWINYQEIGITDAQYLFNGFQVRFVATTDNNQEDQYIDLVNVTKIIATPAASSLEHRWITQNIAPGATTLTLFVDARFNPGTSDDTFTFEWSSDDISYTPTGITISSDIMTTYSWNFPAPPSGAIYLRVVDDTTGDVQNDDVIIDIIRIQHVETGVGGTYSLEHRWQTVAIPLGADDLTLLVNGSHNSGSDDTFTFEYSTDNVVYTPTTLTINSDALTPYSAPMPAMSGQIYLRVVDDNTADNVEQDTVSIDEIRVMWHDFTAAAGSGIIFQVWTEPDSTVNVWNETTAAFEQIYPRAVTSCADCHFSTGTDPVPFGSGKFINHLNAGSANYDYDNCEDCHDTVNEPWYPHDIPHDVVIDWTAYAAAFDTNVGNEFCDVECHYSDLDSRVPYQDASTLWMQDIYTSFTNDGAGHTTSLFIDADGAVECVDCHLDHEYMPDDSDDAATEARLFGGGSIQGCGDQDLNGVGCHVVYDGIVDGAPIDNLETPSSHGVGVSWVSVGRDDCTEAGCHDKHNYPLVPSEGHNPTSTCHPGGLDCGSDTNSHTRHIAADWGIPNYDFNCSQCHFNSAGNMDGWYDNTYGTGEHGDGIVQVRFNTTAPPTVGIATYGNALVPTYNSTGNLECSTTYCHSDGYSSSFSWSGLDPEWDNVGDVCGDCHNIAPTTSSHQKHNNFNCSECHYSPGTSANGWFDTTFGSIQHVDGQVQVNFNTSATGIASYGGNTAPVFNGDDTCDNTYCHSDGYDADGAAPWVFTFYNTPVWGVGSTACGDCHGVPNLASNELSTLAHLKHTRNYGGIYASRNLAWFDAPGGTHSYPDAAEAILQDDGDFFLDPGLLNAAPDILLTEGTAGLTDFVVGDDIFWNDANTDGDWDVGEDIWYDAQGDGATYDPPDDWRLYNGGANDAGIGGGDPNLANEDDQSIMYLNSDQDDGYYSFMFLDGYTWPGTYYYSGSEEPLIHIGDLGGAGVATNSNLLLTYEVLQFFQGDGTYPSIGQWFDDMQGWYDYDCSECHFNNPTTVGYGTYGTVLHVDMNIDVFTSGDPAGVSTHFGAYTPVYFPATMECGVVYCHSDGNLRAGDGNPDFAGPNAAHVEDDTAFHEIYPDWNNPATVSCGAAETSCHFAGDEDSIMPDTEHPNTNSHRRGGHVDADQIGWKADNYDTWCYLCHYSHFNDETYYYHPYGMPTHVDGDVLYDTTFWLNPVTADYGDPCHQGGGSWSGTYGGTGC